MKRFLTSFVHAFDGIVEATRAQQNLAVHELVAAIVLVAALAVHLSLGEFVAILVLISVVLGLELMNTAIEAGVDLATLEHHPLAKRAKDAAAGAVLAVSVGAALAGVAIFADAALTPYVPPRIPSANVQSVVAGLGVAVLLTVLAKARWGNGFSGRATVPWAIAAMAALLVPHGAGYWPQGLLLALAAAVSLSRRPPALAALVPGALLGIGSVCVCLLAYDGRVL